MEYRYAPLIKYIVLLLCIFLFLKHMNVTNDKQLLMISIIIVTFFCIVDFMIICDHDNLFYVSNNENFVSSHITDDNILDKDIEKCLEDYNEEEDIDDNIETFENNDYLLG